MRYPEAAPRIRSKDRIGMEPLAFDHGPEKHDYTDESLLMGFAILLGVALLGVTGIALAVYWGIRWLVR